MLLALVDSLRCPATHDESSLVLSVDGWQGPRVSHGALGCPICHARYPIDDGTVYFTKPLSTEASEVTSDVDPERLGAQLGLAEPGGMVLLTGHYVRAHSDLEEMAGVACILINTDVSPTGQSVRLVIGDRIPLAAGVLRGSAHDIGASSAKFMSEVARCLRPRGRLVAAGAAPVPPGIRELVRDNREWVGEREDLTPMIHLTRATLR